VSNIICIFPIDKTTDFLLPIYESLSKFDSFSGFRSENNEELFESLNDKIKSIKDENNFIVFLGHGASNCLYGATINDKKTKLFDKSNIDLFNNQNIFFLSCRSSDFINNNAEKIMINGIGFGDIITDYSEVVSERDDGDALFLPNINEEMIEEFKTKLVALVIKGFEYLNLDEYSIKQIYYFLKLLINKEISNILLNRSTKGFRDIADLIYDLKNEMKLIITH